MKRSSFLDFRQFLAIITLLIIPSAQNFAQDFQKLYGTNLDNTFSKVIRDGSNFYVLGQDEPSNGTTPHATVTRLDPNGLHQWTLRLDIPSVWHDAVLTPTGDLIVVGQTLPSDATNQSLIGLVTPTGGGNFTWVRSYDVTGREGNYRIIRSPAPENPLFPYYIAGGQFDANGGPIWDDIFLLNMDESGTFNWKKLFTSVADDEFVRSLDVLSNGDLILSGNLQFQGVILQADNTGTLIGGVTPDGISFSYADVAHINGGGFYAVGGTFPGFTAYLMKYDNDLSTLWDATISNLTSVSQVWEEPGNGDIYLTGTGVFNGVSRAVILLIKEVGNVPVLQWVNFLDNSETSYTGGSTTFLSPNQISFVDGRIPSQGGFGQQEAYISVSDLALTTCMTSEESVDIDVVTLTYNAPILPPIDFFVSSAGTDVLSSSVNWQQEFVCSTCQAGFIITQVDNCGHYQVNNTSTGAQPLTYLWCNGSTSEDLDVVLPCGPHTFCLTITDAAGCTSSYEETITVTDNIAPVAVCVPPFGVTLDANCEFLLTPGMIDGGSSDNCQIQSLSVSPAVLSGCGVFPVTLTVIDWCGNSSSCTVNVQTNEDIPPTITCPPYTIVTATTATPCSAVVNGLSWLSATDNCGTPFVDYVVTGATSNFGQNDASGLTYNEGVSTVTYTATDACGNTASCSFEVNVLCKDSCYCGTFSDLAIRFEKGPGQSLTCGGGLVFLSCPPPGYSYTLSGKFECQGTGCPPNAPLDAQLEDPNGTVTSLGSQLANPYFGVPISNLFLQQSGVYTLTLTGHCGSQSCTCVIRFVIDPPCADPCPCSIQDVQELGLAVNQGFAQVLSTLSCKACFTPIALTECETVEWFLTNTSGTPIGSSTGSNSFCYTFPGSGTYTVIMVVTRKKADGTNCETFTKSQTVNITCLIWDECNNVVIDNPGFSEGAVAGGLLSGGMSRGWNAIAGEPEVIEGANGSQDGWTILLSGNLDTASILSRMEPICLEKMAGMVTLGIAVSDSGVQFARPMRPRPCDKIQIQLYKGDQYELNRCNSIDCFPLASISLADLDTNEWHEILIPFDLSTWTALDDCGGFSGVEVRPVIYVTNALTTDQGGEDTYSLAQIDHFCFNGTIVAVNEPPSIENLRIYPNPNHMDFILELESPATHDLSLRINNLEGKVKYHPKVVVGLTQQQIDVSNLPAGMYFLHVIKEGHVISVNKFVKL